MNKTMNEKKLMGVRVAVHCVRCIAPIYSATFLFMRKETLF